MLDYSKKEKQIEEPCLVRLNVKAKHQAFRFQFAGKCSWNNAKVLQWLTFVSPTLRTAQKDCVMTTLWCSVVIWSQENTMENVAWREVAGSGKQEICFWSWSLSRGFFAPRLKPQHEPLSSVLAETNMLENWPRTHGYCMSFDFQSCWSTPFPPTGIFALGRVHLRLGKFAFSFA